MEARAIPPAWYAFVESRHGSALRPSTHACYRQIAGAFSRYAEASGVRSPLGATPALCKRFIEAPLRGGKPPCTATSRLRLTVIRSAFEATAAMGAVTANPTVGLRVHHQRPLRIPIPLTPPEAARLTLAISFTSCSTPWPATCALALLGAAHGEIAAAVVADLNGDGASLELGQGPASRILPIPQQLGEVLTRRAAGQRDAWRRRRFPWEPTTVPLALARPVNSYPVNSVAPTVNQNLTRGLRHAGIHRPGIRPKSLREYAANVFYARTQRIEAVAEQLGLASFDTAARFIDPAWQQRWSEIVRGGPSDDG